MIYFVHGFGFDPDNPKYHPYTTLYPTWEKGLQAKGEWFAWFSAPPTFGSRIKAWWHLPFKLKRFPFAARYYRAWNLSREAGDRLAGLLEYSAPSKVICHSLGSRVTLCALEKTAVQTVLIFNGADECEHALKVARMCPATIFYNVVVKSDLVVKHLGQWGSPKIGFAPNIGAKGLPDGPRNWVDIHLDDPAFKARAREFGYDLRGDNPDEVADHSESYEYPGNWALWRDLLNGTCLMPLERVK